MLKAGILDQGNFIKSEEGSPQGNIASPILANIYAHYVVDSWLEQTVPQYLHGRIKMVRYADDIVICLSKHRDTNRVVTALTSRLNRYSLELNIDKTKVISFDKWNKAKQESFDFLGFTLYLCKSRKGTPMVGIMTAKDRFSAKLQKVKLWCRENRHRAKLRALWQTFNAKLRGHIEYYSVSLNYRKVRAFAHQAIRIFFYWMNRRSQRKSMTWKQFNLFRNAFPSPRISIRHNLF